MRYYPIAMAGLLVGIAWTAAATFAASPGFAGRVADCSACHRPPLQGDDAEIVVEGMPDAWTPGEAVEFTLHVTGGPVTVPTGPQAGFEIEASAGTFVEEAEAGVRSFFAGEATYTEDGVFQRAWNLTWRPPGLDEKPGPVTFWAAGVAANGNHNVQLNTSDQGEHGDSVATLIVEIPASAAALEKWRALPLVPPLVDRVVPIEGGHRIEGTMADPIATHLEYDVGKGWQVRQATSAWRIETDASSIRLRAVGDERSSPVTTVLLGTDRDAPGLPLAVGVLALAAVALARRQA